MSPEALSLIGILLATAVFIVGIFKGYHITLVSIATSAIVILFAGQNIMSVLSDVYMSKLAGTYKSYFLLFFFSAFFAKALGDCGAAQGIAFSLAKLAKKFKGHEKMAAILCLALIQTVFTMGGISLFVVTFTVLYIAKDLFTELDVPWKFYTCASIGTSTFTAGMLPGSPQLTNLIAIDYYGTTAMAAPVLGIICALFCLTLCVLWVRFQVKRAEKNGEGFEPSGSALLASWDASRDIEKVDLPLLKCLLPSIVLFIVMNILGKGTVIGLIAGILATYIIFNPMKQIKNIKGAAMTAIQNTNLALIALASAAGFGGVVAAMPGFQLVLNSLNNIPGPEVFQVIIATNVAAGFAASSSTGQRLALDMLGDRFMSFGIPLPALHRLTAISSIGLDTLPHSSALANTYYMCKLSYKDAYINNFMISVVFTLATAVLCGILITVGITF